jgi:hypothetical protein
MSSPQTALTIAPERRGVNPIALSVIDRLGDRFPQAPDRSLKVERSD